MRLTASSKLKLSRSEDDKRQCIERRPGVVEPRTGKSKNLRQRSVRELEITPADEGLTQTRPRANHAGSVDAHVAVGTKRSGARTIEQISHNKLETSDYKRAFVAVA